MLTNIMHIEIAACIVAGVLVALLLTMQYSRFVSHKKKHFGDEDERAVALASKFAVLPYLVIPMLFAGLITFGALVCADLSIARGWVETDVGAICVALIVAVTVYAFADRYVIGHIGDAVYFESVESKFTNSLLAGMSDKEIQEILERYLQEGRK